MRNIIVYRSDLLPLSETFVCSQAKALQRYNPRFIGRRNVSAGLLSPAECLLTDGYSQLPSALHGICHRYFGAQLNLHRGTLLRRLRAFSPALIHAHFAPDGIAAMPIARALQIPLIVTLHGYDITAKHRSRNPLRSWCSSRQLRALWDEAALFLCVSEFIRNCALRAGFPAQKLLVHHIGVDTKQLHPVGIESAAIDVIFVGRLTEKKGCEYLIRAMQQVQRTFPLATLLILGDGPQRVKLEALAADLEVHCTFLGPQSHSQVIHHLSRSRVCAIPSVTASNGDSEGLPMILTEAQALGIPVVGTRHAGIPEGIVDRHAGLLSDERDVDGLADNIVKLLGNTSLREDLSRRGTELVRLHFDLAQQAEALESIYDTVLSAVPPKSCCKAWRTL